MYIGSHFSSQYGSGRPSQALHGSASGGAGSTYSTSNLSYGGKNIGFVGSGNLGFGKNVNIAATSSYTTNGCYDGTYTNIYDGGSIYGNATWRSSQLELEGSVSFGFGLGNGSSDIMNKNSGYIGGYGVTNR
uniref:Uncharacterized protein n=1 Tax=Cannabis sativa TaxID=3483 RepID=A0A803NP40_CANSA